MEYYNNTISELLKERVLMDGIETLEADVRKVDTALHPTRFEAVMIVTYESEEGEVGMVVLEAKDVVDLVTFVDGPSEVRLTRKTTPMGPTTAWSVFQLFLNRDAP